MSHGPTTATIAAMWGSRSASSRLASTRARRGMAADATRSARGVRSGSGSGAEVGAVAVDGAAPHHPVLRVVVAQRTVVGARLVPHREVVRPPVPADLHVRVLDERAQVPEQRVALVTVHA